MTNYTATTSKGHVLIETTSREVAFFIVGYSNSGNGGTYSISGNEKAAKSAASRIRNTGYGMTVEIIPATISEKLGKFNVAQNIMTLRGE